MLSLFSVPGAGRWFNTGPGDSFRTPGSSSPVGTSRETREAPQSSHESREGWFSKVHRGHGNVAAVLSGAWISGLGLGLALGERLAHTADCGLGLSGPPRIGIGVLKGVDGEGGGRFVAFEIAALRTSASGGFMPQARQGGSGVCALAVAGSKFAGTGLEKEHIGQIQVAELTGDGSGVGRWKIPSEFENGDAVVLLEGLL